MQCYPLTVFVFALLLNIIKGYNLPLPLAFLEPRTKYDYDLTRFFLGKSSGLSDDGNKYQDSPQHDPPIRPYRPTDEIIKTQNEENIKTGFGSQFFFSHNNNYPTTKQYPFPPTTITFAPPAPWIHPTPAPQGSFFGPGTTKQTFNPQIFQRFDENIQQDVKKGAGSSFGGFSNSQTGTNNYFSQPNNYRATTAEPAVYQAKITPTETTTKRPANVRPVLLSSLADDKDKEIKYKETDTDYYDFDEEDLKGPQYDVSASRKLFAEFVKKYGKTYKNKQDEERHYQHFVNSLMTVNRLNSEGGSATFDINIMSDEDPKGFGK